MTSELTLSDDEWRALDALLPADQQTGRIVDDLAAAGREARQRRIRNTRDGAAVLGALHRAGLSWREIERRTGIPTMTAHAWGNRTPGTDEPATEHDEPAGG